MLFMKKNFKKIFKIWDFIIYYNNARVPFRYNIQTYTILNFGFKKYTLYSQYMNTRAQDLWKNKTTHK